MNRRDEILEKIGTVQTLPAAALKAVELLMDPAVDLAEVTRTIEIDPGLTANVLRLANSAYFGFSGSVGSLRDAIVRLGTKQVTRTVMASAAASLMRRAAVKGYDLPEGELWKHSIAVAVASDQLASVLELDIPGYVFTGALLHDVGKIVLGTFVDVDAAPIMKLAFDEHVPFEEAERRVLGIDHAEVGAKLLDRWNLPAPIVNMSRWHHEPECSPGISPALDIVHIADALALTYGIGTGGGDGLNYRLSSKVFSRMQIDIHIMEETGCRVLESLSELRGMFAAATA